jgi:membrane protease YdiL (CAAX protease family)
MKSLLRSRHFWLFVVVYLLSVGVLVAGGRPLEDVIGAFLILGVLLPVIAWATCLRMPEPGSPAAWRRDEGWTLLALLAWVMLFLCVKGPLLAHLLPANPDSRLQDSVNTLLKLAAFVAIPAAVLWSQGWRWRQPGRPTATRARLWLAFIVLAAAAFAVQYLMGSQFRKLLGGDYASRHLALGSVLCFAWMSIEAGVVEEFFFRWFLQSRLAAWTNSQVSAVFLCALLFGLAHAPGMILRGAGTVEGLGDSPSMGTALAYVVATQGVAGLAFGVLWARTRSFVLVVALHGVIDALSNTASFMDTWHL